MRSILNWTPRSTPGTGRILLQLTSCVYFAASAMAANVEPIGESKSSAATKANLTVNGTSHAPLLMAQADASRSFDLPAQSLEDALAAFGLQSGLQVSVNAQLASGIVSAPVQGTYVPQDALRRLLQGTSLTYRMTDDRTVIVEQGLSSPPPVPLVPVPRTPRSQSTEDQPDASAQSDKKPVKVPEITVRDVTEQDLAEIGDPPEPYAGGQVARGARVGVLGTTDYMATPFSITSFTNEQKENLQALSVSDVLRFSPSIQATQVGSNTNTDAMYMRGFFGGTFNSTINGLNGLAFRQPPLEPFERVELLLGASAFANGQPASVGGTINMVTKRAGEEPLARLGMRYMSNSIFGTSLDLGRRFGEKKQFGLRINGAFSGGQTPINETMRTMGTGSLAFDWRGERVRVSLDYIHHQRRIPAEAWFGVNPGVPIPRAQDATREFQQQWPRYFSEYKVAVGRVEVDVTRNWMLTAAFGKSWSNFDRQTQIYYLTDAAGTLETSWANTETYKIGGDSGEIALKGKFQTGWFNHRVTLGATRFTDFNQGEWISTPGVQLTSNIYRRVAHPIPALLPTGIPPHKGGDSITTAYFIGDDVSLFNDRLHLILGARRIQYESNWYDTTTGARGGGYEENTWTPAFGVSFRAFPWLSLYANRVEAMDPGSFIEPPASNAGQMSRPLRSKQIEAGAKADFGFFGATLAVFEIKQPSQYRDPVTNYFGEHGEQTNRGLELSLFGELLKGLRSYGGVSLIDAKIEGTDNPADNGKRPAGVPKYTFSTYLDWDVPGLKGVALNTGVLTAGKVYNDSPNTQTVPSWVRWDLGVRYGTKIAGRSTLFRLNVENVLDEKYFLSERQTLYFAPPRTVQASITIDF